MFGMLLILFIAVPVFELWLIFRLAALTSWPFTLLVVIGTGILGTAMAKSQGFYIWKRIRESLGRGEIPGNDMIDGVLLLVGGILLITPGIMTDAVGLLMLLPPIRTLVREYLKRRFRGSIRLHTPGFPPNGFQGYKENHGDVVDVEWEEADDANSKKPGIGPPSDSI